ncbi:sensor histidine kinase [Polaribacter sp.]|nr:sensor histidine kinase [Polaribacter sp.]
MRKKKALVFFFIFLSYTCFSNEQVYDFFNNIRNNNYFEAQNSLNDIQNKNLKESLKIYFNIIYYGTKTRVDISYSSNESNIVNTINLLNKGLTLYYKTGSEVTSFNFLKKSLQIALKQNDKILICEISKAILDIYERNSTTINDKSFNYFLELHKKYAYDELENKINKYYEFSLNLRHNFKNKKLVKNLYLNYNQLIKNNDPYLLQVRNYIALCGYDYKITRNYNRALEFINKANTILKNKDNYIISEKKQSLNILKGVLLFLTEKPHSALIKLKNIENSKNSGYIFKVLEKHKYYWIYKINSKYSQEALDSLLYKSKYLELLVKLNHAKSLEMISELETKYQTEKKEKENLELKQENLISETKRKRTFSFLVFAIIIAVAGSLIYILSLQNSKRKRKLALQEKEIEQQKNLSLLKEQEINTINAMIDGQEKERVRIAEDLHDNIGSVLSTLKLHFENLKLNRDKKHFNQEELYLKTESLIDETYLKVRKIAHAKNSGVIANQGLLVAVQNMAGKISSADKIKIEVIDYGLDKRIENNIEITVFRIIQELVTNIVKHANATNASINISLFDNNLNVIIEDNGIGFNKKKIKVKDGMGISSIKKRIKHLNGTFKIDSFKGKGTSIIIDIPV